MFWGRSIFGKLQGVGVSPSPSVYWNHGFGGKSPSNLWGSIGCGQNLDCKELTGRFIRTDSLNGTNPRPVHTVSASAMIGDLEFRGKGRCHTGMWKSAGVVLECSCAGNALGRVSVTDASSCRRDFESVTTGRRKICAKSLDYSDISTRCGRQNPHSNVAENATLEWGTRATWDAAPDEGRMGRWEISQVTKWGAGVGCRRWCRRGGRGDCGISRMRRCRPGAPRSRARARIVRP